MLSPVLLRTCGLIGVTGALLAIPADVLSWFLAEDYNPMAQTISALAVGPSNWLIDLGLWAFALACLAVGTGLLALGLPTGFWRVAALAAMGMGAAVAIISFVNGYAGQENAGANLHQGSVFALYVLFPEAALGSRSGLESLSEGAADTSRLAGGAWLVLAPLYYLWFPSGWAGAFERTLALLMVVWLVVVAWQLRREGRQLARPA